MLEISHFDYEISSLDLIATEDLRTLEGGYG
jgi:hypothetical protein